ncbi:MAG: SDR family oxidoreductase [Pseudomonadales bacterium]|nr:SDR family oxidoreductase [Pseudomonadales bacterium]
MDLQIKNKVFLIAGASKGLGFSIAEKLLSEGASVSIASSDAERLGFATQQLNTKFTAARIFSCVCDVKEAQDIEAWVQKSYSEYHQIDGLVVNAGGPPAGSFDDFDDEQWLEAFNLTLMSSVRMIRQVLPIMRKQGSGSILTLSSSSVKEPIDFLLLSNVMRSGVTSLAKTLATAEAKNGIRVNNLIPGIIATDRMKNLDAIQADANGISVQEQRNKFTAQIPLGRYGEPDEFANAAAFLLSDAASYITGSTLVADGGTMKTVW